MFTFTFLLKCMLSTLIWAIINQDIPPFTLLGPLKKQTRGGGSKFQINPSPRQACNPDPLSNPLHKKNPVEKKSTEK